MVCLAKPFGVRVGKNSWTGWKSILKAVSQFVAAEVTSRTSRKFPLFPPPHAGGCVQNGMLKPVLRTGPVQCAWLPFGKLKAIFSNFFPRMVISSSTPSNFLAVLNHSALASKNEVSPTVSPLAVLATA